MDELKPCPFCGSKEVGSLFLRWEEQWRAICNSCGAYTTFDYAEVSCWNARPIEDALQAENARLRKALIIAGQYLKSMNFEDEKLVRKALKGGE